MFVVWLVVAGLSTRIHKTNVPTRGFLGKATRCGNALTDGISPSLLAGKSCSILNPYLHDFDRGLQTEIETQIMSDMIRQVLPQLLLSIRYSMCVWTPTKMY